MTAWPPAITVAQARAIDRDAAARLGMPTALLMENAARSVAETAQGLGSRFIILCGAGNNGGDGLAAARHLGLERCVVYLLKAPDPSRAPDAALQHAILTRAGADVRLGAPSEVDADHGAVWIDALFGTGLGRALEGEAKRWIHRFNVAGGPKLSVDIPSGLHGDSGEVLGAACKADVTVTFVAPKVGMTTAVGKGLVGRLVVAGLGLPTPAR